jgi:hypothetical protein
LVRAVRPACGGPSSGDGTLRIRHRVLPQDEWQVFIKDRRGYTGWDTYQANQARIRQNIPPMAHQAESARFAKAARCCTA